MQGDVRVEKLSEKLFRFQAFQMWKRELLILALHNFEIVSEYPPM
jgi:hypothetical protein